MTPAEFTEQAEAGLAAALLGALGRCTPRVEMLDLDLAEIDLQVLRGRWAR